MQQIGNLDCFFLAKEMQDSLAGVFFENFYDYGQSIFRLRFSKQSILVDLKGFSFITNENFSFPEPPRQPSSFAMLLRKHLASAKLSSIKQLAFDRILEFEFTSSKQGKKFLIVELFGKQGNLLLLDESKSIIQPFKREEYSARKLKQKEHYVLPPSAKKHPLDLKEEDLEGKGKVVSFLSKQTSLAPFYLEEACARAQIALETKVEELSEKQKLNILSAIKSLFAKPLPSVFEKDGKPFAFACIEMQKFKDFKSRHFQALSQAIEEYYAMGIEKAATPVAQSKIEFQLASQQQALKEFEAKAGEAQKAGKWVFENSELVAEVLGAAKGKNEVKINEIFKKSGLKAKAKISGTVLEMEIEKED